jgi:hypothetical protein
VAVTWILLLSVLLVTTNGYFLYLRPQLRRHALLAAIPLLDSELRQDLTEAEQLLVESLAAGLSRRDTRDARFALAWVRAKLGQFDPAKYGDALAVLSVSDRGAGDPAVADLRLWLLAKQGRHDEVLATFATHGDTLKDRPQNRALYAAALEHRAIDLWTRRDVDGAVRQLKKARHLRAGPQVHAPELVELLIEHGMRAITDEAYDAARSAFADAEKLVTGDQVQGVEARLGGLICDWRQGGRDTMLDRLRAEFDGLSRRRELRGADLDDARLLRANVGWWYLVAMLEDWTRRLPAGGSLPWPDRELFLTVVRAVETADPELGDVIMMHGLIDHGLAVDAAAQSRALATLARSTRTAKGVVLTEVLDLVNGSGGQTRRRAEEWSAPVADASVDGGTEHDYPMPADDPVAAGGPLDVLLEQLRRAADSDPDLARALADINRGLRVAQSRFGRSGGEDGR